MKKHYKIAAKHYNKNKQHGTEAYYSVVFKKFLLWFFVGFMGIITFFLFKKNDIKIPQKTISVKIDIKDKINICLPDEQE